LIGQGASSGRKVSAHLLDARCGCLALLAFVFALAVFGTGKALAIAAQGRRKGVRVASQIGRRSSGNPIAVLERNASRRPSQCFNRADEFIRLFVVLAESRRPRFDPGPFVCLWIESPGAALERHGPIGRHPGLAFQRPALHILRIPDRRLVGADIAASKQDDAFADRVPGR
jgi:hypothetical protein